MRFSHRVAQTRIWNISDTQLRRRTTHATLLGHRMQSILESTHSARDHRTHYQRIERGLRHLDGGIAPHGVDRDCDCIVGEFTTELRKATQQIIKQRRVRHGLCSRQGVKRIPQSGLAGCVNRIRRASLNGASFPAARVNRLRMVRKAQSQRVAAVTISGSSDSSW